MNAKKSKCFLIVVTFLFLLFLISPNYSLSSTQKEHPQEVNLYTEFSENTLSVNFWIFLSEHYEFLELNIRNKVTVDIAVDLVMPSIIPHEISLGVPFSLSDVKGLPPGANYTYGFAGYTQMGTLTIHLPAYMNFSSIKIEGYLSGKSVFWRSSAEIPSLNLTSSLFPGWISIPYNLVLVPPSPSRVLKLYSRFYTDLQYQEATIEGWKSLVIERVRAPVVVLFEPEVWQTYAFIAMLVIIFLVYSTFYISTRQKIFEVSLKSLKRLKQILLPAKFLEFLNKLYNEISKLDASKLLTIYVLCSFLMVSLSLMAGPDPRLKAYVMSSTPASANRISNLVQAERYAVALTVFDEMSEFDLLAKMGVFQIVIIGDFFPPSEKTLQIYIYPGLDVVSQIVVIESSVSQEFLSEIQLRYSSKTTIVNDLVSIGPVLRDVTRRANALGLYVPLSTYSAVSAVVGLGSLILFFFGLAFLSFRLIEAGKKHGIGGLVEAIAYSVLIFIFTQAIYIVCGILLAMPLGLHTSSPKVTAIGFLGFGGGSRPRMFAGLIGFLFGALIALKDGLKLGKIGIIAFLVVVFFVVVDPLTSGLIFYEFVLLFTVGPGFETASVTMSYVKDFLSSVGIVFGGWISPIYALSTGIILYYAAAIPVFLFSKLRRNTATVLLLFSAFGSANGGIRIANMRPWSTIACIIPGVMVGLLFSALFYLISLLEAGLKTKMKLEA